MRGEMLMQLVHKYAPLNTVRFKEGAVEAVLQHFQQAEELLGSKDGIFKLDGFGMVQLCAPITARWVLYNTKGVDAISFGAEGRAELEFKRYIGMDRMGGELTGDLSGNGCITAVGRGKSSGGAPAGSKQEKSPAGALQNATVPFAGGREVMAAEPAAPPAKEKKTLSIADTLKTFKAYPGLFSLYQDTSNGAVLMRISSQQIGKEYIYFSHTSDGVLPAGHFRGSFRYNRIVSLQRYYNRVEWVMENTGYYFDPQNAISKAAGANINRPVLASLKIIKEAHIKLKQM
jgi:hypothetical protein